MAFWNSEKLIQRIPADQLIDPYIPSNIAHGAYELCLGPEAFITSTEKKKKIKLDDHEDLSIPPGQFAMLITEEKVSVPLDAIAFISMKFGVKRRGLINVSGFHVDPGFKGRLKFSVYNAGSNNITLHRGDKVFMVWYSDLNGATKDGYKNGKTDQNRITSDDQNILHGEVASPEELKRQIVELRHFDVNRRWLLTVIAGVLLGILVRLCFMSSPPHLSDEQFDEVRDEIVTTAIKQFLKE